MTDNHNNENHNQNDYEVGYKKPPKHSQFKKGQSGNPKGRPPKEPPETMLNALIEALEKEHLIQNGDIPIIVNNRELIVNRLVSNAVDKKKGTHKDLKVVLEYIKAGEDIAYF